MFGMATAAPESPASSQPVDPYIHTTVSPATFVDRTNDRWCRVIQSLQQLKSLRDDWDGQGALAPSIGIVEAAIGLAELYRQHDYSPPTTALATPAGTVLFEWRRQTTYYEIEIVSPGRAEWMLIDEGRAPMHGEF
jgi:hypothetical protein